MASFKPLGWPVWGSRNPFVLKLLQVGFVLTAPVARPGSPPQRHSSICLYRFLSRIYICLCGGFETTNLSLLPSKAGPSFPPLASGWTSGLAWAHKESTTTATPRDFPADGGQGNIASGRTPSVEPHPWDTASHKGHTGVPATTSAESPGQPGLPDSATRHMSEPAGGSKSRWHPSAQRWAVHISQALPKPQVPEQINLGVVCYIAIGNLCKHTVLPCFVPKWHHILCIDLTLAHFFPL